MKAKVERPEAQVKMKERRSLSLNFCLLTFALLLVGCSVDERRAIPSEAQATIDGVSEDIAAGRDEKIYAEAAEEWRKSVSTEENKKILEQARARLGKVSSRAMHSGSESNGGGSRGAATSTHTLVVTYQTTFERGTAMETFQLVEREGRWLLAGYSISSDALK